MGRDGVDVHARGSSDARGRAGGQNTDRPVSVAAHQKTPNHGFRVRFSSESNNGTVAPTTMATSTKRKGRLLHHNYTATAGTPVNHRVSEENSRNVIYTTAYTSISLRENKPCAKPVNLVTPLFRVSLYVMPLIRAVQ